MAIGRDQGQVRHEGDVATREVGFGHVTTDQVDGGALFVEIDRARWHVQRVLPVGDGATGGFASG
jgi:hypothetical protein